MVTTFNLRPYLRQKKTEKGRQLTKQIANRCDECYVPRCWMLKDPLDDGQIYLSADYVDGDKRIRVQIRRLLFLIEYGELPIRRRIDTHCGNKRCVNPAHARVKGFVPSYPKVMSQIERGWLSTSDAEKWYKEEEE